MVAEVVPRRRRGEGRSTVLLQGRRLVGAVRSARRDLQEFKLVRFARSDG